MSSGVGTSIIRPGNCRFCTAKELGTLGVLSSDAGKDLATTYSRGIYKTTTIGKTVFDGRVRDGNGSGHSFMVTKKCWSDASDESDVSDKLLKSVAGFGLGKVL